MLLFNLNAHNRFPQSNHDTIIVHITQQTVQTDLSLFQSQQSSSSWSDSTIQITFYRHFMKLLIFPSKRRAWHRTFVLIAVKAIGYFMIVTIFVVYITSLSYPYNLADLKNSTILCCSLVTKHCLNKIDWILNDKSNARDSLISPVTVGGSC